MSAKTKITSKGQVTIPNEIRKAMNMEEGDYLIFETKSEYEASVKVIKTKPLSSLLGALQSPVNETEFSDIRGKARSYLADHKTNEKKE
ncbi:MAG: AbrB/MazE/SpoVT family DNA-binding domain-containing protein [Paenibacillaceae bacterium]